MKTLKLCGIALSSGLLVGILGGSYAGTWMDGILIWREVSAAAGYEELALLQHEQADPEHARQALLGFTNFSKSMSKLRSAKGDKALLIDAGRTYLRLAAIEEIAGNPTLSHQYVLSARDSFKRMGRDIPEQDLDKQVTKIVANVPPHSPPS
jgi:hypothetical protein